MHSDGFGGDAAETAPIVTRTVPTVANILPWKPVKKLIISLKTDDSSTTDQEDDADALSEMDHHNKTNVSASNGMSADALRAFDNASPASIAMDSPSMAPCSPIDGENSLTASNDANDDSLPTKDAATKATDAFQMKLDEYLKQVRAKTDATQELRPSNDSVAVVKPKGTVTKTQQTEKKTIINLKQKTPVVSAVQWGVPRYNMSSLTIHFVVYFPKAVCHLPISAQLEYRRLINRMKILEKQKEQKSSQLKQQKMQQNLPTPTLTPKSSMNGTPFANIRVTLTNENRFIQTNEIKVDRHEERMSSSSSPPPASSVTKLKDSLKKKVLLKNTLNAAAAASKASNESIVISSQSAAKRDLESQMPSKNVTLMNGLPADASADKRTTNEQEVTVLRKIEVKVNAHR